jgi:LmbE family N-acetylglucosaminyl deacetylase
MRVVFVMAHQDDEIAFASRIRFCAARCDTITCVYLTDGAAHVAASIRDAETRVVLARLGVNDVHFIGSREAIADGSLPDNLSRAMSLLEAEITAVDEVVTLAWEGGHQDHDAAHLIAALFAERRGVRCLEMPLYNGHRAAGLFRVNRSIGQGWMSRLLPLREKLATIRLTLLYRSQRMTWLGLTPILLVAPARELTRVADLQRTTTRPHDGPLFYERRFHYPYERFAANAAAFIAAQRATS